MYSIVLATVLTVGGDSTAWCHGCRGCHGCYGCWGCSGCWGCRGCHGCWGCSCYGCGGWGCGCSGWGCYGCSGGVYSSCWGCYGCAGVVYSGMIPSAAPVVVAQTPAMAPAPAASSGLTADDINLIRRFMKEMATKDNKGTQAAPAKQEPSQPVAATAAAARVTVKLPPDARLWVDQVECPLTSAVRSFSTPPLPQGQTFAYTMRIELTRDGQKVEDRQRVLVSAGRQVEVDFTRAGSIATAQR